jgi:hypothetical protein
LSTSSSRGLQRLGLIPRRAHPDVTLLIRCQDLADLHQQLNWFYSEIGRPSVDPELMIRMLLVGSLIVAADEVIE